MSSPISAQEWASRRSWTGSDATCSPRADRVGRDGSLSLTFERREGGTVLTKRCFTLPLQAFDPLPLDPGGAAVLMLLNPTGGLVGGDHLRTEVSLRDGAHCCLTTPSPTKVYRTSGPAAVQEFSACLGRGAVLEYLPDHLILSPGAALHQSVWVDLAPESLLLLVDAFSVGRVARGERWEFREMVNSVTVQYTGEPLFMDRLRLSPTERGMDGIGGTEGANYIATFSVLSDRPVCWELLADLLVKRLEERPSVQGGVTLLSRHGLLIRLLTATAYHLQEVIHHLWATARQNLLGLPPLNLRKS